MRKCQYTERGPVPERSIEAVEFDKPKLASGQALIQVLAAPINPSDVLTLTGEYGILPPLPAVGGNEGVGRIVELGPDVTSPPVGSLVFLPLGSGTWSTHVVGDAAALVALPGDADPEQLSMMMINPPTASLLLSEFVELAAGDWVIQNAANSAVGTYLVQLAAARGIRTVNVVRRDSAIAGVRAAGGDVVLVTGNDLADQVREATGGAAIRLGIDAVAGEGTGLLAGCLGEGATLVNYGAMSGSPCTVSPASFVFRDLTFRGFWLAKWFRTAPRQAQQALFAELTGMVLQGKLAAPVAARFDVTDIKDAVRMAASGQRDGKVLIVPRQD